VSTQRIHYLTVIGETAIALEEACEMLLARKIPPDAPGSRCSHDWPDDDRPRIRALCQSLVNLAGQPPVVYYSQLVDGYGMGVGLMGWQRDEWPDGRPRDLYEANWGLTYFPSSIAPAILEALDRMRRKKTYRSEKGGWPHIDHLRAAMHALFVEPPFLTMVINECLGPSWMDAEAKASAHTLFPIPILDDLRHNRGNGGPSNDSRPV
jgi:hypothetical protein